MALTENSLKVLEARYQLRDREKNLIEGPDDVFRRTADFIMDTDEERQLAYEAMRNCDAMPNSPTLMNAGRQDVKQLAACFVLPIEDNLNCIFDRMKQTALIHQSGGGTGFSFSRLRPKNDIVGSTGGVASGPVSFMNMYNEATETIKQGRSRRGANMGILRVDHPDILSFIDSKKTPGKLENFNISVAVTEEFMRKANGEYMLSFYGLVNPRTNEVVDTLSAKVVWDKLIQSAYETGDPGVVFIDRINESHINKHLGLIESTNPCGEQELLPFESCNLASVNVGNFFKNGSIDYERMAGVIHLFVKFLDNVIDKNIYFMPEMEDMTKRTRRIGLGIMGWADLLIKLGIPYDSEYACIKAKELMYFFQKETHQASANLAVERGAYPEWKEGYPYRRNTSPTTIAPTGTISIIAGCSSGIEPLFGLCYTRNVMDRQLLETYPYFGEYAKQNGFFDFRLMRKLSEGYTLRQVGEDFKVPQFARDVFVTSHDVSPYHHVKMQSSFQKYVDNSISKTINFPADATVEEVRNAYDLAYTLGCKGITIFRDGSKDGQVLEMGTKEYKEYDNCPECGFLLIRSEGCVLCPDCGWSAC